MKYTQQQVNQALKNAEISLQMERMYPTEDERRLCQKAIIENMSNEDFMREIRRRYAG